MLLNIVLEKTLESPMDYKEIKPVHPKGNQSWISIGRTDAEAEAPILWPLDSKTWLTRKEPDAGKDWRREEKGMTEDEMVWWRHWLNGHEFEQAPGVGDGQGSLAVAVHWVPKNQTWLRDWTDWLIPCPQSYPTTGFLKCLNKTMLVNSVSSQISDKQSIPIPTSVLWSVICKLVV